MISLEDFFNNFLIYTWISSLIIKFEVSRRVSGFFSSKLLISSLTKVETDEGSSAGFYSLIIAIILKLLSEGKGCFKEFTIS